MDTTLATRQQQPRFIDRFARKLSFALLNKLRGGKLTVKEGSEIFEFGDNNAQLHAHIEVHDFRLYSQLIFGGSIGAAEAWVDGNWHSSNLSAVIQLFARNLTVLDKLKHQLAWLTSPWHKLKHRMNRNSLAGSKTNIAAHYDLGNEMYALFLDPLMQYSSAIFAQPDSSLEAAQQHKLHTICQQLELTADDHLLEIGTGWGGLACFAAKHYGCKVTTTTLSAEQFAYAKQRVEQAGLQDKVTLLLQDYRDLNGQYDKLVSVEMIEAVGHEYLPTYFQSLNRLLKDEGKLLIQAITIADQRYDSYRKGVDFIQRYIFPGGCLPSISEMCRHLKQQTDMRLVHLQDYGQHYAQTLNIWASRFHQLEPTLKKMGYSHDFQRLWAFYFAYCEGAFREGVISLVHFEAIKPKTH